MPKTVLLVAISMLMIPVCDVAAQVPPQPCDSWETPTSNVTEPLRTVASSAGLILAGGDSGTLTKSSDGVIWEAETLSFSPRDLFWDGSQFVALDNFKVFTSPSGSGWTERVFGPGNRVAVSFDGGTYVTVGNDYVAATEDWWWDGHVYTTTDLVLWDSRLTSQDTNFSDVVWTGMQFVAVGSDGILENARVFTSVDGMAWEEREGEPLASATGLFSVAASSSTIVATGSLGQIFSSSDGITWVQRDSGVTSRLLTVVWTGRHFVAAGDFGKTLWSSDGIGWSEWPGSPGSGLWGAGEFRGDTYVVGWSGTVLRGSCASIFPDGFESGDTSAWSGTVP